MEGRRRLSAPDRKHKILVSSMQIFAQKGFEAATSRELAAAAGVSEALLYKYFPTKADLYAGLASLLAGGKERTIALITGRPIGAQGFVEGFYFLSRMILFGPPHAPSDGTIDRLVGQSLLGDGSFAAAFLENLFYPLIPYFEECLEQARKDGFIEAPVIAAGRQCLMFHHFIGAIALFSLPSRNLLPFANADEKLREVMLFAFRGVGLTETAIATFVDFKRLDRAFLNALGGISNHESH